MLLMAMLIATFSQNTNKGSNYCNVNCSRESTEVAFGFQRAGKMETHLLAGMDFSN